MVRRITRNSAPEELDKRRSTLARTRWLAMAAAVGLVLYPALTGTLILLDVDLPALPDFAAGVLNYGKLIGLAAFVCAWWCLHRAGSSLSEIGFPTQWRWWQLSLLGALVALVAASTVLVTLSGLASPPSATPTGISSVPLTERLVYIFVGAASTGVIEETVFRGLALSLLPGLLFGGRVWPAVVASTAVFVFAHGGFSPGVTIFRTGISLILCALFLWRRSLRLPIILHWLINAFPYATIP